jgi:hypothetical protein
MYSVTVYDLNGGKEQTIIGPLPRTLHAYDCYLSLLIIQTARTE